MGAFFCRRDKDGEERWWLEIIGKGEKTRIIPATNELMVAQASKAAFSDQDLQDLGRVLDELMKYVKLTDADTGAAKDIDRENLILRACEIRSRLGI